jgi:hypothetical protein
MMVFAVLIATTAAAAEVPVVRVAEDARVVDRVAQASKRDLPRDLLKRIVNEDIDLLRGKRADQTYQYASFDRQEANRVSDSYSIEASDDNEKLTRVEFRGEFVYRLILTLPSRRMVVTKNKKVWLDHVDIEYIPIGAAASRLQNVRVEQWLEPGQSRSFELPEVARQATIRVFARADKQTGYGNIDLTLLVAKIFDNADSPYADAVASAKAILRALDSNDIPSIRTMATRMYEDLRTKIPGGGSAVAAATTAPVPAGTTIEVPAPRIEAAPSVEIYLELQSVEDLLTGTDSEKRQGLDKLHQLVRRLRPGR